MRATTPLPPDLLARAAGIPTTAAEFWAPTIVNAWAEFGIANRVEQAMWIAQCGHESRGFSSLRENLNYSADALMRVWPKRFTGVAEDYQRQPERIANRAYADRLGNGGEQTGDGWRYRGGGLIQLTGRDNYRRFGDTLGVALEAMPKLIEKREVAVRTACLFWRDNRLGAPARAGNLDAVSDLINLGRLTRTVGDAHGYTDRQARFHRALAAMGA